MGGGCQYSAATCSASARHDGSCCATGALHRQLQRCVRCWFRGAPASSRTRRRVWGMGRRRRLVSCSAGWAGSACRPLTLRRVRATARRGDGSCQCHELYSTEDGEVQCDTECQGNIPIAVELDRSDFCMGGRTCGSNVCLIVCSVCQASRSPCTRFSPSVTRRHRADAPRARSRGNWLFCYFTGIFRSYPCVLVRAAAIGAPAPDTGYQSIYWAILRFAAPGS